MSARQRPPVFRRQPLAHEKPLFCVSALTGRWQSRALDSGGASLTPFYVKRAAWRALHIPV
ncbi:hypothetical protein B5F11_11725 [Anaerotruncus colihominis]|uniref:Uncharacterized protein n=1 Tax=Anaerotruncus colihominis TaxID=169435 RepID=A0A1Y4MJ55_9FIRM|nr:hypothetical protein B5F55_15350 [Anaerotruncus colihominis]OUP68784.1 hypothetical protein B5F11_11725 [Anaerotruncus colihominis]